MGQQEEKWRLAAHWWPAGDELPAAKSPPGSGSGTKSPTARFLVPLPLSDADFGPGPHQEALKVACIAEMRLNSAERADQRWARLVCTATPFFFPLAALTAYSTRRLTSWWPWY